MNYQDRIILLACKFKQDGMSNEECFRSALKEVIKSYVVPEMRNSIELEKLLEGKNSLLVKILEYLSRRPSEKENRLDYLEIEKEHYLSKSNLVKCYLTRGDCVYISNSRGDLEEVELKKGTEVEVSENKILENEPLITYIECWYKQQSVYLEKSSISLDLPL